MAGSALDLVARPHKRITWLVGSHHPQSEDDHAAEAARP